MENIELLEKDLTVVKNPKPFLAIVFQEYPNPDIVTIRLDKMVFTSNPRDNENIQKVILSLGRIKGIERVYLETRNAHNLTIMKTRNLSSWEDLKPKILNSITNCLGAEFIIGAAGTINPPAEFLRVLKRWR